VRSELTHAFIDGSIYACNEGLQDVSETSGGNRKISKPRQEDKAMKETQIIQLHKISKQTTEQRKGKASQIKKTTMKEDISKEL
jgi:hypothetical protein